MKLLLLLISLVCHYVVSKDISFKDEIMSHPNWRYFDSKDCGMIQPTPITKNGIITSLESFPWLAQVLRRSKRDRTEKFVCGAAIINKRYLITAAHCVYGKSKYIKNILVGEGANVHSESCKYGCLAQKARIDEIIPHTEYDKHTHDNDIALIRLEDELKYAKNIRPICLPRDDLLENPFYAEKVLIAGWGLDSPETISQILKYVKLPIRDRCVCQNISDAPVNEEKWCIGIEKGDGTCQGDSGSPVVWSRQEKFFQQHFVIGLTTFRNKKCDQGPEIYTNLNAYVKWVLENIYGEDEDVSNPDNNIPGSKPSEIVSKDPTTLKPVTKKPNSEESGDTDIESIPKSDENFAKLTYSDTNESFSNSNSKPNQRIVNTEYSNITESNYWHPYVPFKIFTAKKWLKTR